MDRISKAVVLKGKLIIVKGDSKILIMLRKLHGKSKLLSSGERRQFLFLFQLNLLKFVGQQTKLGVGLPMWQLPLQEM
jgi:hypothetical protein